MKTLTFVILNGVFVAAALLMWPIYQDVSFIILAGVSLLAANAISLISVLRRLRARTTLLITAATYLVLGVPLAIPSGMTNLLSFFSAFLRLFTAPVTSWKDVLTLTLPVGSYQTALLPAFLLLFVVPVFTLLVAVAAKKLWWIAAITALLPMLFAATFGSSATSTGTPLLWFTVPAPREIVLTLASLLLVMVWLSRRRVTTGKPRRMPWSAAGGIAVLAALAVSVTVAPALMTQVPRNVLRAQIDPQLHIDQQTSPLSLYRQAFGNELFDTELFQVSQTGDAQRIRIATLTGFDGQVATVSGSSTDTLSAQNTSFARVPALVDAQTQQGALAITIGALQGIWMPTVAPLESITFTAPRPEALSDGFFYNTALQAGVQLADGGLATGDSYRMHTSTTQPTSLELTDLKPTLSQPRIQPEFVPESLQDWLSMQKVSRSGAGLQTLIERLRSRGYLSHALSIDPQSPPLWATQIPGYDFQPSRAGHSSARIDQLFTELRDRQREVGSVGEAQLVAAVGDDEQFSVAALLLADQLGFNARVVLGTKLVSQADEGIPACTAGSCDGSNLTAWLEVQAPTGEWVAVDVTPQVANPIAPEVDRLQDPQVVTEVQPPSADSVQPPDAAPSQSEGKTPDSPATESDLTWLWVTLKAVGLTLLILFIVFGPFLLIVVLKQLRRTARQRGPEPKEMLLGAWNEYVDTAVDFGNSLPSAETRVELVQRFTRGAATDEALKLATLADAAVFSDAVVDASDSDTAWQLADARKREFRSGATRQQRLLAMISLKSFWRWIRGEQR